MASTSQYTYTIFLTWCGQLENGLLVYFLRAKLRAYSPQSFESIVRARESEKEKDYTDNTTQFFSGRRKIKMKEKKNVITMYDKLLSPRKLQGGY